jgi:hypothetical protein
MPSRGLSRVVAGTVRAIEVEHGPLTEQEIESAHRELFGEAQESGAAGRNVA